eukprot:10818131-Ditylum_brightwellii.AAC.1
MLMNLTGVLLRDVAELGFDFLCTADRNSDDVERHDNTSSVINPPMPSNTVGLQRSMDSHSVVLINESGVDVV